MPAFDYRFDLSNIVHFENGSRYYEVLWRGQLVGENGRRHHIDAY
ncbi:hypothetical protein GCM10022409_19580 [Hymenobacter glaciei]|uniref:WGR domain-containing protein n=1 Tax=Hymenobacter glaciei TaxID=877209 RepID=A0ABP7U2T5_9BACT